MIRLTTFGLINGLEASSRDIPPPLCSSMSAEVSPVPSPRSKGLFAWVSRRLHNLRQHSSTKNNHPKEQSPDLRRQTSFHSHESWATGTLSTKSNPFSTNANATASAQQDNASVLTLASSSKRRRRSLETNASMRALAPSSMYDFNASKESLPKSTRQSGTVSLKESLAAASEDGFAIQHARNAREDAQNGQPSES